MRVEVELRELQRVRVLTRLQHDVRIESHANYMLFLDSRELFDKVLRI